MSDELSQLDALSAPARKWKSYPEYKDSGVEWLGDVPEHWKVKKLKYLTRLDYGDSLPSEAREVGDIPVYGSNGSVGFHSQANTLAPVIVIGRKGSFGKINYSDKSCFAIDTTYFIDSRKTQSDLRWLFFVLQLLNLDSFSEDSAVPGLSREFVYDRWVIGITLPEQRAIASFLDHKTAHLDTLISKKKRLIALLEEKRAALISRAVTKGLDPNVKMKDSEMEWLGEVPEHWEVKRMRFVCEINPSKSEISRLSAETLVSFLPMEMIDENGTLSLEETRTIEQVWQGFTYFKVNDVILAKITPCFENGKGAICSNLVNNIGFGTTELHVIRSFELSNSRFIYYLTKSDLFRKMGTAMMYGAAGQQRVPEDFIKNFKLGLPQLSEQHAIASFLDRETTNIDALIAKIKDGIEKLYEYRTALISAAVTGKIDVREAV